MPIRYPQPLGPGDVVAVTSPSSGVAGVLTPRLDVARRTVEARGYRVVVGECMAGDGIVSAPKEQRAAELESMLLDPSVRAIVPPWGGETAIDLLDLLDWDAIAAAEPTWLVGYSDIATIITPLTLRTAVATVHGNNLMDTPYAAADGLVSWLDIVAEPPGATVVQSSPGRYRADGRDDWQADPAVDRLTLDADGRWERLDSDVDLDVQGRLIGGCIETLSNLAGTAYADVAAFAESHAPEGLLVYVEAAEDNAASICRNLHGMRLAGFFAHANAVVVGRTNAPSIGGFTQRDAVLDALGGLGLPIVADVECGHVAPFMPIVNGALGRLVCTSSTNELTQELS